MLRISIALYAALMLVSCAAKPPVQAMAEARAAIQAVRPYYSDQASQQNAAYRFYQSAEKALFEATSALDAKRYELATRKANEAKRQARLAAKLK